MREKKPVAKIVPIQEPIVSKPETPFRLIGAYRGQLSWDDDAFKPMTDQELMECGLGCLSGAPLLPALENQ